MLFDEIVMYSPGWFIRGAAKRRAATGERGESALTAARPT